MSRGIGVAEWLAATLDPIEPLLALVTQLGDVWFLTVLAVAVYWFGERVPLVDRDRDRGLLVLVTAFWAFAATFLLKGILGVPRPAGATEAAYALDGTVGALYAGAATATGYGFPSGHAVGAAAVYGTLAWPDGAPDWRRLAVAAGVIVLVCLTRLGLGVHTLVDVVAGLALGLAIAAVALRLADRPEIVVALATATGLVLLGVHRLDRDTTALVGAIVGVAVGLGVLHRGGTARLADGAIVGGCCCLVVAAGLAVTGLPVVAAGLAGLGGGVVVLALPATSWRRERESR